MVKKLVTVVLTMAMLMVIVAPATARYNSPDRLVAGLKLSNGLYIVQMIDNPVVAYTGGINGLNATKPAKGQKIDPQNTDVIRYAAYLDGTHNQALASVGGRKVYDYHYTFNGFAAELSASQAAQLKNLPSVVAVSKDEVMQLDTSNTPTFLGLNAPGGLWDMLGGVGSAGENIIIGDVDGGIWPEHPSFSDRTGTNPNGKPGKLNYQQIPGWHGMCVPGEAFNASNCNQKLIGARYYNAGFGGNAGIDANYPWEFNSPRDYGGHGSHTASTAGGNYGVPATGAAAVFGAISGMAPRARIAAYKVCWQVDPATGSCFSSDSVAAIDQAVADGVDVINFSISGTSTNFLDPVEVAFLFAADAGVFVATSAGNNGPSSSTVAHPGPWETTVAAGTHNRDGQGSVTLGNGATYYGASVATAVGPASFVDSENAGLAGADPNEVRLCYIGTLDPAVVTGKIVLCDRGVIARVDKSNAVLQAGGIGMVMVNTSPNSINADLHFVPTVHLQDTDRAAVKAYANTVGATATINQSTIVYNAPAPFTASFSSRGPLRAAGGDLLKPDLIAPGQDILAAVAPPNNAGRLFDVYSGTSMSSPHVAGLGALLKNLHPDWSPMMIKSALMTSAYDVLDSTTTATKIFRQGAGHVDPNKAADPGLVFDSGFLDWLAFLCGTGQLQASYCPSIAIDPSDLNMASIAIGDLAGSQTVTRTAMNVGSTTATYNAAVTGVTGVDVVVTPSSLTLDPGESGSFDVSFTTTTATLNAYTGGFLTWSDGTHNVRLPIVVRPVALAAPAQVNGDGSPLSFDVRFGYNGSFSVAARGLIPAVTFTGSVADDPGDNFTPGGPGTVSFDVTIPAGTTYARFSLFDSDVSPASDLDLYVYNSADTLVAASGSGTSQEEANLLNPPADTYTVWVHGYGVPAGSADFTLFTWALDSTDAGNMTVSAPASALIGTTGTISLTFSGLTPGIRYLGSLAYSGASGMPNPTIVRIDP